MKNEILKILFYNYFVLSAFLFKELLSLLLVYFCSFCYIFFSYDFIYLLIECNHTTVYRSILED
jgi:hypothetical protein